MATTGKLETLNNRIFNMSFEKRCKIATECLPEAKYREMISGLHSEMLNAISVLQAQNKTMLKRLREDEKVFRKYAQHHAEKCTAEGKLKSNKNTSIANKIKCVIDGCA